MARYDNDDRVTAFAGVFQAARLARDIARNGVCDAGAFEASRESLFDFEPASIAAIFGGVGGVAHGLRVLQRQLEQPAQRDLETSRYAVALLHLADRLMRSDTAMQTLHDDLVALQRRRSHFDLGDSVLHEQLGRIYQDRISPLGPRILVKGEPLQLQNPDNAARIRVALLAGIRAAVAWRQSGGRRWHLLLRRSAIAATCRSLLAAPGK